MGNVAAWTIEGANGQPIFGDAHAPKGDAVGVILIAHGFKGYKDYGMFPVLARTMADAGFIAHRFNFSHSGMTNDIDTFARPDLFEQDTWNKQVHDFRAVIDAVANGPLVGAGLPLVIFGHSRGGVSALLTAGRFADDASLPSLAGVITAAAPSDCCSLPPEQREELLDVGYLVSPSSRTNQDLRVGRAFLQQQIDEPAAHDLLALAARIICPVLVVHGSDDPTVPPVCAEQISVAIGSHAERNVIGGANHVFNTPNPMPSNAEPSPQLAELLRLMVDFCLARTA